MIGGWHAHVDDHAFDPSNRLQADEAQSLYGQLFAVADQLRSLLIEEDSRRRQQIMRYEGLEEDLTLTMVLLMLISLLVLARLSERQRSLVEELQRRGSELERVGEEKSRYVRGITHDLKNPLGAIDGFAILLETGVKGDLSHEQRQYMRRIRGAVEQMLGTLDDLLQLARADAGEIEVERRSTRISALVEDVAEDYRASLETRGLTLSVEAPMDLPPLYTDSRRVKEILGNLLSNALKYTPRGGAVRIRARAPRRGPVGRGPWIALDVEDTGPGIHPDEQSRIFDEFHRIPGEAASGTGLGLAISRRMAHLIGGDITVESSPGDGSTFSLWLPVAGARMKSRRK
jgi:signal transduction histidine kinase